jgi:hypothetical protein
VEKLSTARITQLFENFKEAAPPLQENVFSCRGYFEVAFLHGDFALVSNVSVSIVLMVSCSGQNATQNSQQLG